MAYWIGTYAKGGGRGLYPLAIKDGKPIAGAPEPGIVNASFAVWSPRHRRAYFVDEQDQGRICAWRWDDGRWTSAGALPSGGAAPCYVSLSRGGKWLAVANYGDGTLALFRLDPATGMLLEQADAFRPTGSGPDAERQDGPHAHCAIFGAASESEGAEALYHVDLGLDRVFRHDLDNDGIARTQVAYQAPAGSGPRHLAWHPDGIHALLICELAASLLLLRREGDGFVCLDMVPTAPQGVSGQNLGGHLSVEADGTIRVTNRGHDSLADFAVIDGKLQMQGWRATHGSSPRHFVVTGGQAIVGHEASGGLTQVSLSGSNGQGDEAPHRLDIPSPVFILDMGR